MWGIKIFNDFLKSEMNIEYSENSFENFRKEIIACNDYSTKLFMERIEGYYRKNRHKNIMYNELYRKNIY